MIGSVAITITSMIKTTARIQVAKKKPVRKVASAATRSNMPYILTITDKA